MHRRHLYGRPDGRGPKDVGHGRATAGDQDYRAVAGRAQRPILDAGQASGGRRDSPLHPVFGAHVRGYQTVDGGKSHAAAGADQDHDGPVAASNAKGRVYFECAICVIKKLGFKSVDISVLHACNAFEHAVKQNTISIIIVSFFFLKVQNMVKWYGMVNMVFETTKKYALKTHFLRKKKCLKT